PLTHETLSVAGYGVPQGALDPRDGETRSPGGRLPCIPRFSAPLLVLPTARGCPLLDKQARSPLYCGRLETTDGKIVGGVSMERLRPEQPMRPRSQVPPGGEEWATTDEADLLAIDELESRLTPDGWPPGPPNRQVGWGC